MKLPLLAAEIRAVREPHNAREFMHRRRRDRDGNSNSDHSRDADVDDFDAGGGGCDSNDGDDDDRTPLGRVASLAPQRPVRQASFV